MKTATLKNVKKLIRQNLRWGLLLNKVTGFKPGSTFKNGLRRMCFRQILRKLRNSIFKEQLKSRSLLTYS